VLLQGLAVTGRCDAVLGEPQGADHPRVARHAFSVKRPLVAVTLVARQAAAARLDPKPLLHRLGGSHHALVQRIVAAENHQPEEARIDGRIQGLNTVIEQDAAGKAALTLAIQMLVESGQYLLGAGRVGVDPLLVLKQGCQAGGRIQAADYGCRGVGKNPPALFHRS